MNDKSKTLYINLDVYESLEQFVKQDAKSYKLLKFNLARKHHDIKVEFLRYFIV